MKQKHLWITLAIAILIFMAKDVFAESVVTRNVLLSPFYVNSLTTAGQNYNFTFDATDGLSRVLNALLKFKVFISGTVNFTASVNSKPCNNPFFFISSSYTHPGQAEIIFDCSNIINTTGRFNVSLRPSANTGSVVGLVEITYINKIFTDLNSSIISVNDTVKNINATLPASIWTFSNRTLTSFDFLVNVTQQVLDNIASTVWTFPSRTLTAFNFLVDLTSNALNNIASAVWNFDNRTVDKATFVTNVTNVHTVFNVTSISDDVLDDIAFRVLRLFIGAKNILFR
jgi:hypothetical protein